MTGTDHLERVGYHENGVRHARFSSRTILTGYLTACILAKKCDIEKYFVCLTFARTSRRHSFSLHCPYCVLANHLFNILTDY